MIVRYWNSEKYKISFLGIPKTGSSTVRAALGINPEKDWALKPAFKKTFTILREPVKRLASSFKECQRRGTLRPGYEQTFTGFMFSVKDHGFFDEHAAPMSLYFKPVERVFLLENLGEVWEWLDIEPKKNFNVSPPYEVELNEDARAIIYEIYGRDFLLYNNFKRLEGVGFSYKIGTTIGYFDRFYEIKHKFGGISDMAAYKILEREYFTIFEAYKYASYKSFKNQQSKRKGRSSSFNSTKS